jgi:hypothetical protein
MLVKSEIFVSGESVNMFCMTPIKQTSKTDG